MPYHKASGKKRPMKKAAQKNSVQERTSYKKGSAKKVPAGYHRMPDGSLMKGATHKKKK